MKYIITSIAFWICMSPEFYFSFISSVIPQTSIKHLLNAKFCPWPRCVEISVSNSELVFPASPCPIPCTLCSPSKDGKNLSEYFLPFYMTIPINFSHLYIFYLTSLFITFDNSLLEIFH